MTSSLVGSEMCIRDRVRSVWRLGQRAAPLRLRAGAGADPAAAGPPPGAVSYTHLTLPTICSV
eukprot:10260602-Prorocentrum_lima.AAC.1